MSRFPDHNDWVRSFYVSNPTLHKKGYTVYKVVSKVFPKNSVEAASQVIVWKRYSDFSKLYKALLLIYQGLHLKGNFPKFAKAQFFGRFEEDVIEERRQSALHLLEFAAKYPVLFNSQVFVKFFERSEEVNDEPEPEMSGLDPPLLALPAESPSKFNGISAEAYTKLPEGSSMGAGDSLSERPLSHRITALDQLSLDSRTTEEETDTSVRSTTTEGEDDNVCNAMRPPRGFSFSDLAMFDPILQSQGSEKEDCPSLSNAWILSAAGMCANLAEESCSPPGCAFSFPKPFQDLSPNDDDDEWLRLQEDFSDCQDADGATRELRRGEDGADAEVDSSEGASPGTPVSPLDVGDATYLQAAANWASRAHSSEAQGDFLGAFTHYKAAVGALLEGVQGDRNARRRDAVRRKTAQYLARAEHIYESQLSRQMGGERRWSLSAAPVPQPAPPPVAPSGAPPGGRPLPFLGSSLRGSVQELAQYKVIGIVGNVLLALDTEHNTTVVIKVLHKSPSGAATPVPSVVPQEVPHMVNLLRVYETESALFLVLEYATGGRLWDYLGSYVRRHELEPAEPSPSRPSGNEAAGASPCRERSPCPPSRLTEEKPALPLPSDCDIANCDTQWSLPATPARDQSSVDKGRASLDDALPCECRSPNQLLVDASTGPSASLSKTVPVPEESATAADDKASSPSISERESSLLDWSLKAMTISDERLCPQEKRKDRLQAEDSASGQPTMHLTDNACCLAENVHRKRLILCKPERMSGILGERLPDEESKRGGKAEGEDGWPSADNEPVERRLSYRAAEAFRHLDGMARKMAPPRRLPEACVRQWAAEMALALCHLHRLGVVRQDLCPHDVLLADGGHIVLTYCCQFNCVDRAPSQFSRENQYSAPEIDQLGPVTPACDWWSFGAILYELFVGVPLVVCHPGGVTSTTRLSIPSHVSVEAADLLEKLLAYHPHQRLGHGPTGSEDIRCHPFFAPVNWAHMASR